MTSPAHGMRLEVEREEPQLEPDRVRYRGVVLLPDASLGIVIEATAATCVARLEGSATPDDAASIEKSAAALVRAATRAELARGAATPRKIVRWRERG